MVYKEKHSESNFYNYNYLFLNASLLDELLNGLDSSNISWDLFERFKACCIYVGKGSRSRKFEHIAKAKKLFMHHNFYYSYTVWRINMLWKLGTGIHFPIEVNHFEAHCRECAMIKSLGRSLTSGIKNQEMHVFWVKRVFIMYSTKLKQ